MPWIVHYSSLYICYTGSRSDESCLIGVIILSIRSHNSGLDWHHHFGTVENYPKVSRRCIRSRRLHEQWPQVQETPGRTTYGRREDGKLNILGGRVGVASRRSSRNLSFLTRLSKSSDFLRDSCLPRTRRSMRMRRKMRIWMPSLNRLPPHQN